MAKAIKIDKKTGKVLPASSHIIQESLPSTLDNFYSVKQRWCNDNNCYVEVNGISGIYESIYGVLLSRGITSDISFDEFLMRPDLLKQGFKVAKSLTGKGGGHDKFLESIQVWLTFDMPRYFWQQFDTYRIGTKQSESTMYSLGKRDLSPKDFTTLTPESSINTYNFISKRIKDKVKKDPRDLEVLKASLPEGFLQKRVLNFSFKSLYNIRLQRPNHKLSTEWGLVCDVIDHLFLTTLKVSNSKTPRVKQKETSISRTKKKQG